VRRLVLMVVVFCLAALPGWADYGLSNVVEKKIDRSQPSEQKLPASPEAMSPSVPAKAPEQTPARKESEEAAPSYQKTVFYPYTIHISSWQGKKDALNHRMQKAKNLDPVFITKIDLGATGIWYRVDYGAFPSQKDASSRMSDLQSRGIIDAESFIGSAVPYTIELGVFRDKAGASSEADRLMQKGVAAYILKESDSAFRLVAGAYPGQKSAGPSLDDFAAMGLKAKIVKR